MRLLCVYGCLILNYLQVICVIYTEILIGLMLLRFVDITIKSPNFYFYWQVRLQANT